MAENQSLDKEAPTSVAAREARAMLDAPEATPVGLARSILDRAELLGFHPANTATRESLLGSLGRRLNAMVRDGSSANAIAAAVANELNALRALASPPSQPDIALSIRTRMAAVGANAALSDLVVARARRAATIGAITKSGVEIDGRTVGWPELVESARPAFWSRQDTFAAQFRPYPDDATAPH